MVNTSKVEGGEIVDEEELIKKAMEAQLKQTRGFFCSLLCLSSYTFTIFIRMKY